MAPLLLAIGTGAAVTGSVIEGRAAKAEGENIYKLSKYNAEILRQRGEEEARAAAEEATYIREQGRKLIGSQRVGFAASGVTSAGTPGVVTGATAVQNEIEALRTIRRGSLARFRAEQQAGLEVARGRAAKYRGRKKYYSSILTGGGQLASGIYNIGDKKGWWEK